MQFLPYYTSWAEPFRVRSLTTLTKCRPLLTTYLLTRHCICKLFTSISGMYHLPTSFCQRSKRTSPCATARKERKKDLALNDLRANLFSFFLWLPKGFSLIKLYNLLLAPQKSVKPGLWGSTNGGQWHNYQLGVCNTVLSNMVLKEHSRKSG